MDSLTPKNRSYFSQSPDIFARRMKIGNQALFFGTDIHPTGVLGSPTNQELHSYWQGLSETAGGIPRRKDFKPTMVRRVLPYISLIEALDGGDFRIRLTGTETDRVLGFSAKGSLISELPPELAEKWGPIYRRVLDGRQPFTYRNPAHGADINSLELEAICLPFRHDSLDDPAKASMIMTAFDICTLA